QAIHEPRTWGNAIPLIIIELAVVILTVWRALEFRLRVYAFLLIGFTVATLNMFEAGLTTSRGATIFVLLPIIALIFLSKRSGILVSVIIILDGILYTISLNAGLLNRSAVPLFEGSLGVIIMVIFLGIEMSLLILFYNFQERLIDKEHGMQAELVDAQTLLQEQNVNLEIRVKEDTAKLLQRNNILTAIYKITDAASAARDMDEFFTHIHHIVGELMYAENFFIALYDESSGLLSFPYCVDQMDDPLPTQPLEDFHGLTGYMIRTGNSVKHGWEPFNELVTNQEAELIGSSSEDGVGAPLKIEDKVIGAIYVQSYVKGIHYTDQDDEVLAYVAQHIAIALNRFRALNAERQRTTELAIINSVQSGLAAELDTQGIIDLVGDNLYQALSLPNLIISLYDEKTDLVHYHYVSEKGQRLTIAPRPPEAGGIMEQLLRTNQATCLKYDGKSYGFSLVPETQRCKSGVAAAIISGDCVLGVMQLENFERENAYGEAELRLLTTIAASLGAALENGLLASQRNEAIKSLRESEEKYRLITENSDDVIWTTDIDFILSYVSPSVRKLRGVEPEEALLESFSETMTPESLNVLLEAYEQNLPEINQGKDATIRMDIEQYLKDGSTVWVEICLRTMRDRNGNLTGYVGMSRDIMEVKQAEAALKEAKEAAEAANRSKSAFLANMSHEIRTPMNAILGFSQLMRRDPDLSSQQRENLEIINHSGEHLLALINDILELSKIEAGRLTFVPSTFDIYKLLDDLEMMFRIRTEEKKLSLMVEKVGAVPRWITSDEGKLRQVLINLLGNAVKFTGEGGVGVRMGVQEHPSGKTMLVFEVEDTGPGIPQEEIDTLFEAFEQGSTGIRTGGTGLGLALSKGFIQIMDGTIRITSTVGKGSIFIFAIPLVEGREEQIEQKETPRRVSSIKPGQDEFRVLIADDRETNRRLLSKMLSWVGFKTREVVNGAEAVAAFNEWNPQVILMDIVMPVMDGYAATRVIKEAPHGKDTVIIAITASAFLEDRQRVLAAGADGYLSKPFKESELLEIIHQKTGIVFLYDEQTIQDQELLIEDDLQWQAAIAALPSDLVQACRAAVGKADIFALVELLADVSDYNPSVAQKLNELASNYAYEEIANLLPSEING
ncbi:MAG: ATP-binding protein, partial [Chloroflexota bacterium]